MEQRARIVRISPLELAMRDVREHMADFVAEFGFRASADGTFEILSIEPAPQTPPPRKSADVVLHPRAARR